MPESPATSADPSLGVGAVEDPHHAEAASPQAQGFVALLFGIVALLLLVLAPVATRPATQSKGWWMEPATWSVFTLLIVLLAAGWQVAGWVKGAKGQDRKAYRAASLGAFGEMGVALEYSAYFCVYLFAVGYLGFALSSLIFLQFVTWRAGLLGWPWRLKALAFVVFVVLAFRVGIELWFPLAPLYEALFPDWFVQSIAIYL
jgi:hypothetical protein